MCRCAALWPELVPDGSGPSSVTVTGLSLVFCASGCCQPGEGADSQTEQLSSGHRGVEALPVAA